MKNITATILTLAMLLSLTACGGNNDTPATTTATAATTTANTTPATTTATADTTTTITETTAPVEEVLPEFDINSDECLMYRLLDMTYEEIEAEFGELTLQPGPHHGYWYPEYRLSLNGTECYEITFHYEDANDKGISHDSALPINVSVVSDTVEIFPNIKEDQKPDEVSRVIARWDEVIIYPDGIGTVTTVLYMGNYELRVMWDTPDEMRDCIRNDIEGKTDEEKETICQSYADEFLKNLKTTDTKVKHIYVKKK